MSQWGMRNSFRNAFGLFFRMRKMSETNAQPVSARLAHDLCLERERTLHRCDASTTDADSSVRIHAYPDSSISTDTAPLSRHVIGSAGWQQAALPLEGGHAAVAASADRI